MAIALASLTKWGAMVFLSVIGLRTPARAEVPPPALPNTAGMVAISSPTGQSVLRKLNRDPRLRAASLSIAERNGIVELGGTVPVSSWRTRAARIASVVRDVRGVVNRISVVAVSRPDEVVAEEVRRSLRGTAALARLGITVRVREGVVELTGVIDTWEQQQLAERATLTVPGVRFCQNQLTSSTRTTRTAAVIAADIRSRLDWDPLVQRAPIEVVVNHGRVALKGKVGGPAERRRVIAHAWVKGVVAVDAKDVRIDVVNRPDPDVRLRFPTDAEISSTLQELRPSWPSLSASNLRMSVVAGIVTLRGTVQTLAEKRAAEDLVRSAVGVVAVDSELRGPWWRPPVAAPPQRTKRPKRTPRRR